MKQYIEIASATRKKYVPPPSWHAGAAYIELFSGPCRSLIRGTKRIIDGSPLVAFKVAQASVPFTEMHFNDFDAQKSSAVDERTVRSEALLFATVTQPKWPLIRSSRR